jgi:hypothetical protein
MMQVQRGRLVTKPSGVGSRPTTKERLPWPDPFYREVVMLTAIYSAYSRD